MAQILTPTSIVNDAAAAIVEIEKEREDKPHGLKTRFPILNRAVMRHFRFGMIYAMCGASGSGKSYLANMMRTDFTDQFPMIVDVTGIPSNVVTTVLKHGQFKIGSNNTIVRQPLNADIDFEVLNLHFGYEMHNKWELLRTVSTLTGWAFEYLLSSYGVRTDPNSSDFVYNKISDGELELVRRITKAYIHKRPMLVFKHPGSLTSMYQTVAYYKNKFPKRKLIVSNDHTLLHKKEGEKDDQELVDEGIKVFIRIRDDFDAMVIPIAQTNSEMEKDERKSKPELHYPSKKDLYRGGQFYQGCDWVFIQIMPSKFGIEYYGPKQIPTHKLIHLAAVKSRYAIDGQIWFTNHLDKGKLVTAIHNDTINEVTELSNLNGY